jgi:hypothetical protein
MTALRSRRLEQLFGAQLDAVTHDQVLSLVTNSVSESYDLDFKGALYGTSDKAKRDLGSDVAAMANTAGGVVVLGVEDDDQGRAARAPGVELDDAERRRIRQIVVSQVSPLPVFDTVPVEDPHTPGRGFILLAMPRSVMAPHAVIVNESLRFPRRNGTTTTYLTEPQVAAEYRARFVGIASRLNEAEQVEREFVGGLNTEAQVFVALTLVLDSSGAYPVNTATFEGFKNENLHRDPLIIPREAVWQRASVRRRRFVGNGSADGAPTASYLACELHESGSGTFAAVAGFVRKDETASGIEVDAMINAIASGLRFLARHARDKAAAGGLATVRATIWSVSASRPVYLFQNRSFPGDRVGREIQQRPVADGVFDLDDLAEDGQPLMVATYMLATGLFQEFGVPEAPHVMSDGTIRCRYWQSGWSEQIVVWAKAAGVPVTDETDLV